MGGPIRVNYNVIELPCIPSLCRISFWKEDCASPYTLFGADQSSLITVDPGIELHGGSMSWENRARESQLSSVILKSQEKC